MRHSLGTIGVQIGFTISPLKPIFVRGGWQTMLYYIGLALIFFSAAFGVVSAIVLAISGRRLKKRLEEEYGSEKG